MTERSIAAKTDERRAGDPPVLVADSRTTAGRYRLEAAIQRFTNHHSKRVAMAQSASGRFLRFACFPRGSGRETSRRLL
ncbi:hypothetical protein [Bacillus paralicheniformis]|uniref:hypothetical protein n=1 Tax=Bacillus paralicheniformis TaxID=1648923 RepID=UPI00208F7D59|nr:hypothetical protein [Bacillus paralicheniformis]